jgi:hypothetical protein
VALSRNNFILASQVTLKPSDRVQLISEIGRAVQAAMKVADIPGYLAAFGVRAVIDAPVTSKWVLIREALVGVPEATIIAIAHDLKVDVPGELGPGTLDLSRILSERGMSICQEDFSRALATVEADPAQAIGHACSSLESICKTIIEALGVPLPRDESFKALVKTVSDTLDLSPDKHADPDLKQLLGGLANAAAGIAVIRTKYSAFHGKSPKQRRLVGRHARLAVNSAAAVGLFLVETYLARVRGTPADDLSEIEEHIAELEEQQNAPFTDEARARIVKMFRPPPKNS